MIYHALIRKDDNSELCWVKYTSKALSSIYSLKEAKSIPAATTLSDRILSSYPSTVLNFASCPINQSLSPGRNYTATSISAIEYGNGIVESSLPTLDHLVMAYKFKELYGNNLLKTSGK